MNVNTGFDKIMLRKRAIIESVVDQLKNISQIEHSRHRNSADRDQGYAWNRMTVFRGREEENT